MAGKKVSARVIRGLFNGVTVGIFGGTGIYIMTSAVNSLAGTTVINPIAMLLLVLGGCIAGATGIELSKDLEDQ